jgi:prepilin signal peptidase PulO-like enzyme (type II secretory pathway)
MDAIYYILGIIFILGLGIGSFLNVVLFRMTSEKKFWNGRSECMSCHHTLEWYELIPLLSYIIQKGRCRECAVKLSPQYPLVELLTAVLFTGFAYLYIPDLVSLYTFTPIQYIRGLIIFILITQLIIVFVYDLQYQLISVIQLRAIQVLGLIYFYLEYYQTRPIIPDSLITAITSAGIVLFLYIITKKQGIGWGDVELFAGLGLFIPLMWFVPFFFGSFVIGMIWGIWVMLMNRNSSLKQKIAFGPSIILSFVIIYTLIHTQLVPSINIWYYWIIPNISK